MDRLSLIASIEGIQKEIRLREVRLNHRRAWYLDPVRFTRNHPTNQSYDMYGFYIVGYRILQEIKRLKEILCDLVICLRNL